MEAAESGGGGVVVNDVFAAAAAVADPQNGQGDIHGDPDAHQAVAVPHGPPVAVVDWDDRLSWEDSERFDGDSLCSSPYSDSESLCQNWRGWSGPSAAVSASMSGPGGPANVCSYNGGIIPTTSGLAPSSAASSDASSKTGLVLPLLELAAKQVAINIPFEVVERFHLPVPETLQLRIAFWSFPETDDDIRLYSCLANGNVDEFNKGQALFESRAVDNLLQIGFHLSGTVSCPTNCNYAKSANNANAASSNPQLSSGGMIKRYNVTVTLDRRKITSCNCTCSPNVSWCAHVVALCLHRVHMSSTVCFRAPLSESLSRLEKDQLQKFSQYLISELPRYFLPTAQKLLDSLLSQTTLINVVSGAPDPTAGASLNELACWCMEDQALHENIRKILHKFCQPTPTVCDVNYLSSNAPPASSEWTALLRPLRGREPEGLFNLLSIVREMYRRHDCNAVALLHIITQECLNCDQIVLWWFHTKLMQSLNAPFIFSGNSSKSSSNLGNHMPSAQYSCATLFDEIVSLWRLAILNPSISSSECRQIFERLRRYHVKAIEKVYKLITELQNSRKIGVTAQNPNAAAGSGTTNQIGAAASLNLAPIFAFTYGKLSLDSIRFDLDSFPGFRSALEIGLVEWVKYKNVQVDVQLLYKSNNNNSNGAMRTEEFSPYSSFLRSQCVTVKMLSKNNASTNFGEYSAALDHTNTATLHTPNAIANANNRAADQRDEIEQLYMAENSARTDQSNDASSLINEMMAPKMKTAGELAEEVLTLLQPIADPVDLLFARCEGLFAHGYLTEASRLAVKLVGYLLDNPPDLTADVLSLNHTIGSSANVLNVSGPSNMGTPIKSNGCRKKKKSAASASSGAGSSFGGGGDIMQQYYLHPRVMQVSVLATNTMARALFLFGVLYEDPAYHKLAFRIGIWALELIRQPAASKFLEVKLCHQENEIVSYLKLLNLGDEEMHILRECALKFRNGFYNSKPLSVLPLSLATYLFDCMCAVNSNSTLRIQCSHLTAKDDQLGFEAAVAALALKSNVAESDHPLLCEGTRRQKGELALALLLRYKDDSSKTALIMDQLLDSEMHRMYKHHATNAIPFVNVHAARFCPPPGTQCTYICSAPLHPATAHPPVGHAGIPAAEYSVTPRPTINNTSQPFSMPRSQHSFAYNNSHHRHNNSDSFHSSRRSSSGQQSFDLVSPDQPTPADAEVSDVSDVLEEMMLSEENRDDDGNFHIAGGIALANVSADETQSPARIVSDSSSSVDSSSSGVSRGEGTSTLSLPTVNFSVSAGVADVKKSVSSTAPKSIDPLNKTCYMKISRQRKYVTPSMPNQPSEAHAHFMNELAKRLLTEAGGNHSTAIFTTPQGGPQANQQHGGGPHRALHLCAFQIGLYALGLHNKVTPNWLSRTYSSHVSWISGQAMEIGRTAMHVLIASWENHLTPTEVANLADKGSQSRDPGMVAASAELALSALSQAHALSQTDIQRALVQCKEQNQQMLIKACLAVEQAAKDGGVYPDVLFKVAQQWYQLYVESNGGEHSVAETQVLSQHALPQSAVISHHAHHHHHHHGHGSRDRSQFIVDSQQQQQHMMTLSGVPVVQEMPSAQFLQQPPPVHGPPSAMPSFYQPRVAAAPHHHQFHTYANAMDVANQHHQSAGGIVSLVTAAAVAGQYAAASRPPSQASAIYGLPTSSIPTVSTPGYCVTPVFTSFSPASLSLLNSNQQQQQTLTFQHVITNHPPTLTAAFPPPPPPQPGMLSLLVPQALASQHLVHMATACGPVAQRMTVQNSAEICHPNVQQQSRLDQGNNCYLYAAYRVGMLALETLGRRIHDERSYVKYTQNPPYGDDVKWLLKMSRKLGIPYVQQFCAAAVQAVVSPFVLWDLAVETALYFGRGAPQTTQGSHLIGQQQSSVPPQAFMAKALTHPCVQPLMQRCVQMFYAAAHQKLSHPRFMQSDSEEVCTLVRAAYTAFHHTGPNSGENFDAFMQSLRRQKACKKELWNKLLNILSS